MDGWRRGHEEGVSTLWSGCPTLLQAFNRQAQDPCLRPGMMGGQVGWEGGAASRHRLSLLLVWLCLCDSGSLPRAVVPARCPPQDGVARPVPALASAPSLPPQRSSALRVRPPPSWHPSLQMLYAPFRPCFLLSFLESFFLVLK